MFQVAVTKMGVAPSEFWLMNADEFWSIHDFLFKPKHDVTRLEVEKMMEAIEKKESRRG